MARDSITEHKQCYNHKMTLVSHLIFAFGSMAYATYVYFFPSRAGMRITYALIGLTFMSGFWLGLPCLPTSPKRAPQD